MQNMDFIYNYNFSLIDDIYIKINSNFNKKINFSNYIKLIDLITRFNKIYLSFKKKYNKLSKFNISKKEELVEFESNGDIDHLVLALYGIDSDIFRNEYGLLHIYKSNNIINSYITTDNDNALFNYSTSIKLDRKLIEDYFNLLKEYKILIEIYELLKQKIVFSNGEEDFICGLSGNLFDKFNTFDLTYVTSNMDIVDLNYKLGKKLFLLSANLRINDKFVLKKSELYKVSKHLLKNLYVENSSYQHVYK